MTIENKENFNIEDTGALMTSAKGKNRVFRLILIIISMILVILIAFIGVRKLGDKRYNDQIAIAEKAFAEGDYKQAEIEYLTALKLNKRKVKGREGIAYIYAVLEKFNDSSVEYTSLYDDTKLEKYKNAAEETSEGRIPSDPRLVPGYKEALSGTLESENNKIEISDNLNPEESVAVLTEYAKQLESEKGIAEASYNVDDSAESEISTVPTYGVISSKVLNENGRVPVLIVTWCENRGTINEILVVKAYANHGREAVEIGEHLFRTYMYNDNDDYYGDGGPHQGSKYNVFFKNNNNRIYLVCEELERVVGGSSPVFQTIYDISDGSLTTVKAIGYNVGWCEIDGREIEGRPNGDYELILFGSSNEEEIAKYKEDLEAYSKKCEDEIATIQSAYGLKEGSFYEKINEQSDHGDGLICKMICGRDGRIVSGGLLQ